MALPIFQARISLADTEILPPYSDKAILPAAILSQIIDTIPEDEIPHPLIFKITNDNDSSKNYIGVKEFSSPEQDLVLLPKNIFQKVSSSDNVTLELVTDIEKAKSLKLHPKQNYNILNWKFFLENTLNKFYTSLSTGELLVIEDNNLRYELDVVEINGSVEPCPVSIIDTDVVLDIPANEATAFHTVEVIVPQQIDVDIDCFLLAKFNPTVFKIDLSKFASFTIKLVVDDESIFSTDLIAGLDKFLNMENFRYSTMDDFTKQKALDNNSFTPKSITVVRDDEINNKIGDYEDNDEYDKWLYVIVFSWDKTVRGKLIIDNQLHFEDKTIENVDIEGKQQCSNCLKYISADKLVLHENFCKRNNVRCSQCNSVFLHEIPQTHWHCPHCEVYGNNEVARSKHLKLFHDKNYQCACGKLANNYFEIVRHKSTECPLKLHQCRFCHMILPQGEATYIDKFENLTNHENQCGNKTTECYKCNKIFRLKDIRKHLRLHDLDKQQFNLDMELGFRKCSNENCTNEVSNNNELDLCEICYGPLYIQEYDPNKMKLQQRIERKYMLQLTKGCGNSWCTNEYCLTNKQLQGKSIKEKLKILHDWLFININHPILPINKSKTVLPSNRFWFCTNESMAQRKLVFDVINSEQEYSPEIIHKAINIASNELDSRTWLKENAIQRTTKAS